MKELVSGLCLCSTGYVAERKFSYVIDVNEGTTERNLFDFL